MKQKNNEIIKLISISIKNLLILLVNKFIGLRL